MRKEGRVLSKHGQLQPHFHSGQGTKNRTVKWSVDLIKGSLSNHDDDGNKNPTNLHI